MDPRAEGALLRLFFNLFLLIFLLKQSPCLKFFPGLLNYGVGFEGWLCMRVSLRFECMFLGDFCLPFNQHLLSSNLAFKGVTIAKVCIG